jgi:hypothetical protein
MIKNKMRNTFYKILVLPHLRMKLPIAILIAIWGTNCGPIFMDFTNQNVGNSSAIIVDSQNDVHIFFNLYQYSSGGDLNFFEDQKGKRKGIGHYYKKRGNWKKELLKYKTSVSKNFIKIDNQDNFNFLTLDNKLKTITHVFGKYDNWNEEEVPSDIMENNELISLQPIMTSTGLQLLAVERTSHSNNIILIKKDETGWITDKLTNYPGDDVTSEEYCEDNHLHFPKLLNSDMQEENFFIIFLEEGCEYLDEDKSIFLSIDESGTVKKELYLQDHIHDFFIIDDYIFFEIREIIYNISMNDLLSDEKTKFYEEDFQKPEFPIGYYYTYRNAFRHTSLVFVSLDITDGDFMFGYEYIQKLYHYNYGQKRIKYIYQNSGKNSNYFVFSGEDTGIYSLSLYLDGRAVSHISLIENNSGSEKDNRLIYFNDRTGNWNKEILVKGKDRKLIK